MWPSGQSVAEVRAALRIDGAEQTDRLWSVDPRPGDMHLDDRLRLVEELLADNWDAFVWLTATCEIDLFVSWTPKEGQDGVLISPKLIKLLGELDAFVAMDTHIER